LLLLFLVAASSFGGTTLLNIVLGRQKLQLPQQKIRAAKAQTKTSKHFSPTYSLARLKLNL